MLGSVLSSTCSSWGVPISLRGFTVTANELAYIRHAAGRARCLQKRQRSLQLLEDVQALEEPLLELSLHRIALHAIQALDRLLDVILALALVLLDELLLLVGAALGV